MCGFTSAYCLLHYYCIKIIQNLPEVSNPISVSQFLSQVREFKQTRRSRSEDIDAVMKSRAYSGTSTSSQSQILIALWGKGTSVTFDIINETAEQGVTPN